MALSVPRSRAISRGHKTRPANNFSTSYETFAKMRLGELI